MGSPQHTQSYMKGDIGDSLDMKSARARGEDELGGDERRKQRSSKIRKPGSSSGEKNENQKRSSSEDNHETRKDSQSKQIKKNQEESALESLSNWYRDGGENRHGRANESERRKSISNMSDHESCQSRSKDKDEKSNDGLIERGHVKESRHSDRNDNNLEKGHGSSGHNRDHKKRGDGLDAAAKVEDSNYVDKSDLRTGKVSDSKPENTSERNLSVKNEPGVGKNRDAFLYDDKGVKSYDIDSPSTHERVSVKERLEDNRQQRYSCGLEIIDSYERSFNVDEDGNALRRDKSIREIERFNRSGTPERSARHHRKPDHVEKHSYCDEKLKGTDGNWSDMTRHTKEGGALINQGREWESQRRGRERADNERVLGRSGGRKDGNRTEAVKTSSSYGISNENYDVIEIQTKPFNYPRENREQNIDINFQAGKGKGRGHLGIGGQTLSNTSHPPHGNQESGYNNRDVQGDNGNRLEIVGRGRPTGIPIPMMGSPFGPIGIPTPGPPMSPGVFIPPFTPPGIFIPPFTPPRFPPNIGTPPNTPMYFNQSVPERGMPPNMTGPGFNAMLPTVHGQLQDKPIGGWVPPPRINAPLGKAPSRGEQNDYSQNFVDTGMRPQNYIRELELTSVIEDYPRLRELLQKKDEIVTNSNTPPMYYKCDLHDHVLSSEFFRTKFDVILVDPPWEEYVHRAPGVTDHMEYWTFEEIMSLKIEAIADTPSFIFLWVGAGVGLEQGRQCLKKWGFRRCEDICWVKTNKTNATPGLRHDAHTLFQHSKEHCLMGIKGTVRRSTDGHIIHANIDTDVLIAEEPPYGSTEKPEDMYRIIEHFSLGRRRLELFGEDHNIRSGWLTVGKDLSSSNFNSEAYVKNFADKDGKIWQGGGGRNPPPEAGHLVVTTPDIESLRPKSPMKNQQQLQHQHSNTITLTTANSSNRRQIGNSPTNHSRLSINQEASSSNLMVPVPWEGYKGGGGRGGDDRNFDVYSGGYNTPFGQVSGEYVDFEARRAMNLL